MAFHREMASLLLTACLWTLAGEPQGSPDDPTPIRNVPFPIDLEHTSGKGISCIIKSALNYIFPYQAATCVVTEPFYKSC